MPLDLVKRKISTQKILNTSQWQTILVIVIKSNNHEQYIARFKYIPNWHDGFG